MFIVNDPYLGGTHLMDVRFVKPFFHEGGCSLARQHRPLAGRRRHGAGRLPRPTPPRSSRRALRLPPVKLWKKGVLTDEIPQIILSNIRVADQRIGDIKAQAAALATGERSAWRR